MDKIDIDFTNKSKEDILKVFDGLDAEGKRAVVEYLIDEATSYAQFIASSLGEPVLEVPNGPPEDAHEDGPNIEPMGAKEKNKLRKLLSEFNIDPSDCVSQFEYKNIEAYGFDKFVEDLRATLQIPIIAEAVAKSEPIVKRVKGLLDSIEDLYEEISFTDGLVYHNESQLTEMTNVLSDKIINSELAKEYNLTLLPQGINDPSELALTMVLNKIKMA